MHGILPTFRTAPSPGYYIFIGVIAVLVSRVKCEALRGSLARCSTENAIVRLPILSGNPCIVCRCKDNQVVCTRLHCPTIECSGSLVRMRGRCCPSCVETKKKEKPITEKKESVCIHQDQKYLNGASWYDPGCKSCRCANGSVSCQLQKCNSHFNCPKGKKPGFVPGGCCIECVEDMGICTSYGDPHYQTFDGRMFNFHGNCRYRLVADCRQGNFSVRLRSERHHNQAVGEAKSLVVHIGSTVIHLQRGLVVKVNRKEVQLPYQRLPSLQIDRKNFMITLLSETGVKIIWDGESYIEVHVSHRYRGNTCGLCGNFNGVPSDDFMMKNGRYARSDREFGKSWSLGGHRRRPCLQRAPSPPIAEPISKCRRSALHHWRARKRCWPIKSQFSNCHPVVKPHKYYKACISEVCKCLVKRCECESLVTYARACRRMGVNVNWGRKKACGVTCKGGSMFDDCVPACKRTCANKGDPPLRECTTKRCVAGCQCPAGQVWDENSNRCILTWMCPPPITELQERRLRTRQQAH